MMEPQNVLDEQFIEFNTKRRRDLLPKWIRVFCWIFMVLGGISIISFIAGIFGINYKIEIYGLRSNAPLSPIGLLIFTVFIIKAVAAYGLWFEKNWAILLGFIDGTLGLILCLLATLILPHFVDGYTKVFSFRLEVIAIIPFMIKLTNIKSEWNNLQNQIS